MGVDGELKGDDHGSARPCHLCHTGRQSGRQVAEAVAAMLRERGLKEAG